MTTGPAGNAELTLTSVDSKGQPAAATNRSAQVAANGRYVVFQSYASLPVSASVPASGGAGDSASRVYVRDLVAKRTTLLSNPVVDAEAPSISADGRLVSYVSARTGDVYVVDRRASGTGAFDRPGNLAVRRVTGTSRDLSHGRTTRCPDATARVTPCGPVLSADGHTLAYATVRDPESRTLLAEAQVGDGPMSALSGDLLDFTPYRAGEPYGTYEWNEASSSVTATVRYRNAGLTAIRFGNPGLSLSGPAAGETPVFTLTGSTCNGSLPPGTRCTVRVTFDRTSCSFLSSGKPHLVSGKLTTHSSDPAGQSVLNLGAFCFSAEPTEFASYRSQAQTTAADAACPAPPSGLPLVRGPAPSPNGEGAPVTDLGPVDTERPYVMWRVLTPPSQAYYPSAQVVFAPANGADCGLRLVDPSTLRLLDPPPAGAPPPCANGEFLRIPEPPPTYLTDPRPSEPTTPPGSPPTSCTAYVLVQPTGLAPDAALLGTSYYPYWNSGYSALAPDAYIAARGTASTLVARRDASGKGDFASSRSAVVNVTSTGVRLPDAVQPTLSATGRYVAFAAPVPYGQAGQQAQAGASQVWRHDTDAMGNGSYHAGKTILVSCLPSSRAGTCTRPANADSPSLSGDARAIAFATTPALPLDNGFASPPVRPRAASLPASASTSQVYLRSTTTGRTTLVSTSAVRPGAGGDGASYAPTVSADGRAVAYVSAATDLTLERTPSGSAHVYLHRLGPHDGGNRLLSTNGRPLTANTVTTPPSIDGHGRLVTFPSTAVLVPDAPVDGIASIYTVELFPKLDSSPGQVSFGSVLLDSGARTAGVRLTNGGPGPGTVTRVELPQPFAVVSSSCAGVVYPGNSCLIVVRFPSDHAGPVSGYVGIVLVDDGEPATVVAIPISATVPTPELHASPDVASSGDVTHIRGTGLPPDRTISLRWSLGLGTATVRTTEDGTFETALVIFPNDVLGPRTLFASTAARPRLASAPFLVQPPSQQPPFHRN